MFFVMVKICEKEILMDLINLLRLKEKRVAVHRSRVNYFKLSYVSTVIHSDFQIIRFNWEPEKNLLKKVKVEKARRIKRGKKQKDKSFFTVITSFHKSSYFLIYNILDDEIVPLLT